MDETVKYNAGVGAVKATKNTFVQIIIWVLSAVISNWELIYSMLPKWKEMTLGAVIVWCLNFAYNWLKNKNPN